MCRHQQLVLFGTMVRLTPCVSMLNEELLNRNLSVRSMRVPPGENVLCMCVYVSCVVRWPLAVCVGDAQLIFRSNKPVQHYRVIWNERTVFNYRNLNVAVKMLKKK